MCVCVCVYVLQNCIRPPVSCTYAIPWRDNIAVMKKKKL